MLPGIGRMEVLVEPTPLLAGDRGWARAAALGCLLSLALPAAGLAAERRYKVTVDSLPTGATVYLEAREAGALGSTPHVFQLKPGTYTVILEAEGYEALSKSITVKRKAASFTFTLTKKPSPSTLALEAASGSGLEGSVVKVNGKETGKLPVTLSLQPGRYLIEVTRDGYETYSKWVDMGGAERRKLVVALVKSAAATGALLVSSNIVGAEVFMEGKRVDTAPTLIEKLNPGKYTVEVRAKGYLVKQQEATVEAGKTSKLFLQLDPDQATVAASTGTLQVLASHKEVEVLVDGQTKGTAPVKVEGLAEGTHVVEGRKAGHKSAEQTVAIKKGELATIKLTLHELEAQVRTGALRVISPTLGAEVFIDGKLAGKTPLLRHQLDPGPHFVAVRAKGHEEVIQTVEVKPGQIAELQAVLKKSAAPPPPTVVKAPAKKEEPKVEPRGLSSFGAHLMPAGSFTADVSLGFTHIFEGRMTAGFFSKGPIGMDGGIEFRTFGALSEIGMHAKLRLYRSSLFAIGTLFAFGGGGGPSGRTTAYAKLGVVSSLWFKQLVTFTARAYFDFYTDRLCPGDPSPSEVPACSAPQPDFTPRQMRERFGGARFLLSAILEVPVSRRIGLFALFEGAPGQGNRQAFTDRFVELMPESDPAVYFRVGASFKY